MVIKPTVRQYVRSDCFLTFTTDFVYLKILNSNNHCDNCYRAEDAKCHSDGHLLHQSAQVALPQRDWTSILECLKRCDNATARITYVNPLKQGLFVEQLNLTEVLIPSMILTLFVIYVFIKSNFFAHLYDSFHFSHSIGLSNFIILMTAIALSINLMIQMGIIYISKYFLSLQKELIYHGMVCITPLLIAFHISIVLHDLNGIATVSHLFPILKLLETILPSELFYLYLAYGLIMVGALLSFISLFYHTKKSGQSFSTIPFSYSLLNMFFYFLYTMITLLTIKYFQYFSC